MTLFLALALTASFFSSPSWFLPDQFLRITVRGKIPDPSRLETFCFVARKETAVALSPSGPLGAWQQSPEREGLAFLGTEAVGSPRSQQTPVSCFLAVRNPRLGAAQAGDW